jgi:hypothetical protein
MVKSSNVVAFNPLRFDPDLYDEEKELESMQTSCRRQEIAKLNPSANIVRWRYKMGPNEEPLSNPDGTLMVRFPPDISYVMVP